jgi:uncharacterized protein YrrD
MLLLGEKLKSTPVMSLQTGAEVARLEAPIIDPGILDIVAYRLSGPRLENSNSILLTRDIREVSDIGIIIDSADELVTVNDILKIQKIVKLNFKLINLEVIDDLKHRLGKIYDYTIDPLTFTIHQLHVRRPLLKSLQTSDLIIGRTQIIEVNNKSVIVKSATLDEQPAPVSVAKNFINPFRNAPKPNVSESKTNAP